MLSRLLTRFASLTGNSPASVDSRHCATQNQDTKLHNSNSLASYTVLSLRRMANAANKAACFLAHRFEVDEQTEDSEIEAMMAHSITCQLAAIAPSEINRLPESVVQLVAMAQELHPLMAEGAAQRELTR